LLDWLWRWTCEEQPSKLGSTGAAPTMRFL